MKSFLYFLAFFLILAVVAGLAFYIFSIRDSQAGKIMVTNRLNFSRPSKKAGYEFLPEDKNTTSIMSKLKQLEEERESSKYIFADTSMSIFSTMSASGSTSRIPCKSISISIEEESPLLSLTALSLVKELEAIPLFQTITVYPPGKTPEFGKRKSDLYIRLKSTKDEKKKKSIINITAGPVYLGGRVNMGQPELIMTDYSLKGDVDIEKLLDINDNSLLRIGKKIGKEIAEKTIEEIQKKVDDWGVCPEFPDYMHPAYTQPPELVFLKDQKKKMVYSTNDLMTSNSTFWIFNSKLPPKELQESLIKLLNKYGWEEERPLTSKKDYLYLRVNKKEKGWFMAIKTRDKEISPWIEKLETQEKNNGQYRYSVSFMHVPTNEEAIEILQKFLKEEMSIEQALIIANYITFSDLSRKQKKELPMEETLDKLLPEMNPKQMLQVAKWKLFESKKYPRGETVRRILLPAFLKECWRDITSDTYKEITKFAKSQKIQGFERTDLLLFKLTEEQRKKYGIHDIADIEGKTLTLKTGDAVPVRFNKDLIKSWCIYRKSEKEHYLSKTTKQSEGGYSRSYSTAASGYPETDVLFDTPVPYKINIKLSQDGKTYTFTITKGSPVKKKE